MRLRVVVAVCLVGALAPAAAWQSPPASPAAQTVSQQNPVFRSGVDVMQLDVSVLDKDHHPIHGLTKDDFIVKEDGDLQPLIGVSEVRFPDSDDAPAAWLRLVPPDVDTNNIAERFRDSRVFAIVLDDFNIAFDDEVTIGSARSIARAFVNRMGPFDVASVIYTRDWGNSQDFTNDRRKLLEAIDAFQPRPPDFRPLPQTPPGGYPREGDMQRHDEANRWSRCETLRPTVPTLLGLTQALAQITQRRKTIILLSTGEPSELIGTNCIASDARDMFFLAQRANISIYPIDPAGLYGAAAFIRDRTSIYGRQGGRGGGSMPNTDFLQILSENTGGDAFVNTDNFDAGLDEIFEENGSYYLLGYRTTHGQPDGKYHKLDVKVRVPGATIRTKHGYFGPRPGQAPSSTNRADAPSSSDLNHVGVTGTPGLTLRIALAPFARPQGPPAKAATVLLTLGLREPAPAAPTAEVMKLITSANLGDREAVPMQPRDIEFTLEPTQGDVAPVEWTSRLELMPGRYEVRVNAHSKIYDRSATVYGDVDVPDFSTSGVRLSGIVFGSASDPTVATEPWSGLLSIRPTSERSFSRGQAMTALVRIYQGGDAPIAPVGLHVQVLDAKDAGALNVTETIAADRFGADRAADYRLDLSTLTLQPGPHLLDIQALLADGSTARRDVPFTIR